MAGLRRLQISSVTVGETLNTSLNMTHTSLLLFRKTGKGFSIETTQAKTSCAEPKVAVLSCNSQPILPDSLPCVRIIFGCALPTVTQMKSNSSG